jgi:signal transduction histidine kinase
MRPLRLALWPATIALGVVAEWVGRPEAIALDAAAGFALCGFGLLAWTHRPDSRAGPIMAAGGVAWFVGTFGGWAVFLHRGPLAHLLGSYPSGALRTRVERVTIAAAYAYAAVYPLARNDYATLAYSAGVAALCTGRYVGTPDRERRARAVALAAALALGSVIATASLLRLTDGGNGHRLLWAYDLVVLLVALGLFVHLVWLQSSAAAVTGLVVDLGDPATATRLGDRLARALGDPTLAIAYALPDGDGYVDETGRRFVLPTGGDRAITSIDEDGRRVAVLVHDAAVLDDPALVSAVSAATRLAMSNSVLQADVRARVAEVEASRRRIVESADAQRLKLEQELREGAERRLARVADVLSSESSLADLAESVEAARRELRDWALGIHPGSLVDGGLTAALADLAERAHVDIEVTAPAERLPARVEAAAYFVCSEALTNVEKHAQASLVTIRLTREARTVVLRIEDDGVGGADSYRGSGLQGLADRVEALGGRFVVESPGGRGTRLLVQLPV